LRGQQYSRAGAHLAPEYLRRAAKRIERAGELCTDTLRFPCSNYNKGSRIT